jgi:hypothetical protein
MLSKASLFIVLCAHSLSGSRRRGGKELLKRLSSDLITRFGRGFLQRNFTGSRASNAELELINLNSNLCRYDQK